MKVLQFIDEMVEFMFQLTAKEKEEVVAKCDHLGALKFSPQLPYVFTEYGAVMLASVLNSDLAIAVNIQIVKVFTRMREMLMTNREILLKLEQVERQTSQNTEDIQSVFAHLRKFLIPPDQANRRRIGFRQQEKGK
jgi:hypothetical protein